MKADAKSFDMPEAPASFAQRGGWLVNRLAADFDLTLEQAAGIVGNLGFESNRLKTMQEQAPIGGRGGWGWGQWTASRRVAFERWAAAHNLPPAEFRQLVGEIHRVIFHDHEPVMLRFQ